MDLTYKQRLFVAAYLGAANGNASEAARIAGYSHPQQLGHQLLKKTSVRVEIERKLESAAIGADEVLARLSEIATGSLGAFMEIDEDGRWRFDLAKAKRSRKLGLLRKIKATETVTEHATVTRTEIELHNQLDALDKLARYHGLYKDRPPVVDDGLGTLRDFLAGPSHEKKPAKPKQGPGTKGKARKGR